jgi:hypothetical protein
MKYSSAVDVFTSSVNSGSTTSQQEYDLLRHEPAETYAKPFHRIHHPPIITVNQGVLGSNQENCKVKTFVRCAIREVEAPPETYLIS